MLGWEEPIQRNRTKTYFMYHDFSSLKGKEKMFYMCFFSVSLCKYLHKQQLVHKILGCRGWWRRVCTLFLGELCGVS